MTGVVLLLPNGVEGRIIGQLDGPLRFDFWGYEMRQAVFETVRDDIPPLYEVELEDWEDEIDKANGRRKDDHSAGWFDYQVCLEPGLPIFRNSQLTYPSDRQPTSSLLIPDQPHPRIQATYLVAMPCPPPAPFPEPSFNKEAFNPEPDLVQAEPHDLELATLTYEIDVPTCASLVPIGTPLFRPTTRTHWVRTGRRRDQGPWMF